MKIKDFYIHLGRLLYAVAKADGNVQDEELTDLYKLVITELKDEAVFGLKNEVDSYYTEFEFEALMDKDADVNEALNSFFVFIDEHGRSFTPAMSEITMRAAIQVAESYQGIVPEEQDILDKIHEKIKLLES